MASAHDISVITYDRYVMHACYTLTDIPNLPNKHQSSWAIEAGIAKASLESTLTDANPNGPLTVHS
ncbi:MAG: hypothetical protein ACQ9ET_05315 [Nitrosomonadaceae bacterium]